MIRDNCFKSRTLSLLISYLSADSGRVSLKGAAEFMLDLFIAQDLNIYAKFFDAGCMILDTGFGIVDEDGWDV